MSFEAAKTFLDKYRKEHPFVFYFLLTYLGALAFYSILYADTTKPMALNEVGDFLAGAFSPIAFLFLYLGYRQNSEALRIQSKELKQSTEALTLQVAEMKESVEQQKIMGEFQKIELEEKHMSIAPIINGHGSIDIQHGIASYGYSEDFNFIFVINNFSENDARNFKINLDGKKTMHFQIFEKNSKRNLTSKLTSEEIAKYKAKETIQRVIEVEYENIFGRSFSNQFVYECTFHDGSSQSLTENLGSVMVVKDTQPH